MSRLLERWSSGLTGESSGIADRFIRVFSVDVLVKGSGILLLPLYLALMTQEEYATFNYLTAVIGVLALVFNFGLYIPQSKLVHDVSEAERGSLLLTINLLLAGLLLLCLLPTYLFGWDARLINFVFSDQIIYENYIYLIPIGVTAAVVSQMTLNYFLTREMISRVQRYNLSRLVLGTGLTLGALYWMAGDRAELRLTASLLAEFAALAIFLPTYLGAMRGRFNRVFARQSLTLGLPIMVSAALGIVINFGDKYFIEKFCSLADMSVYFLGLAFANVITVVFMAFQNVWLPLFLKEKDLTLNISKTRKMAKNLLLGFSLLAVTIWLAVAGAFAVGILNQAYIQVLGLLPILMIASICSSLVGLLSVYTVYWGMTHMTIVIGIAVAAVSVPLNFLAARDHGTVGIAVVSVLLHLLYVAAYLAFIRFRIKSLASSSN